MMSKLRCKFVNIHPLICNARQRPVRVTFLNLSNSISYIFFNHYPKSVPRWIVAFLVLKYLNSLITLPAFCNTESLRNSRGSLSQIRYYSRSDAAIKAASESSQRILFRLIFSPELHLFTHLICILFA